MTSAAAGAGPQHARDLTCVFIAFGTRGDVQPLAVLATALAARGGADVAFVTHAAHEPLLAPPLRAAGVQLVGFSSPPAAVWRGQAPVDEADGWHSNPAAREACVAAVAACFAASPPRCRALLVFNLFALEGWHLAEALRVPCVAAAPYVVPYAMPRAFRAAFSRELPALDAALCAAPPGALSWRELEHWMWPLWTERWGDWRADRLGLPALPLAPGDDDEAAPLPQLPAATPLLYGFSAAVVERPGYWPDSVAVTGAWHAPPGWEARGEPPAALRAFLDAPGAAPVAAVTFGSMASIDGVVAFPRTLLRALAAALAAAGLRGVLLVDAGTALASAWRAACDTLPADGDGASSCGAWPHLLGVMVSVPHDWLFPRCAAVLHHAGSGTAAAALRAGVPHATCPCMFDQRYWAEKLEWLGVAAPPLSRARVLAGDPRGGGNAEAAVADLTAALRAARAPELAARAAALGAALRAEDGAAVALAALARHAAPAPHAAAAAAALLAPREPAKPPAPTRMTLPGGMSVLALCPEETAHLYEEIFVADIYLRNGIGARLPRGALVLDVGANIGLFSLRLAALFASRDDDAAAVVALEPLPACFDALRANIAPLRCVRAVRAGVVAAAAPGEQADFTFYPAMPGNSTLHPDEKSALQRACVAPRFWAGASRVACPVSTLSAFMAAHLAPRARVALLKLDVEGAELDALRGVAAADWSRVDAVAAEVHDVGSRVADVAALLRGAGGFARVDVDRGVLAALGAPRSCVMVYAQRTTTGLAAVLK